MQMPQSAMLFLKPPNGFSMLMGKINSCEVLYFNMIPQVEVRCLDISFIVGLNGLLSVLLTQISS